MIMNYFALYREIKESTIDTLYKEYTKNIIFSVH